MKRSTLILIILILVAQTCKTQKSEQGSKSQDNIPGTHPIPESIYVFHFKNESDYTIEAYEYDYFGISPTKLWVKYAREICKADYKKIFLLLPGEEACDETTVHGGPRIPESREKLLPYCEYTDYVSNDSLRIYFNKGKSNERYVTYRYDGFKPRDIRNIEEYTIERYSVVFNKLHYTFTNEDYNNAEKHKNATPVPIPECSPDQYWGCGHEKAAICWFP